MLGGAPGMVGVRHTHTHPPPGSPSRLRSCYPLSQTLHIFLLPVGLCWLGGGGGGLVGCQGVPAPSLGLWLAHRHYRSCPPPPPPRPPSTGPGCRTPLLFLYSL